MKKCFIILVALLTPLVTNADAVEIDGIWYNLINKNKSAEVIKRNTDSYSGNIEIPASVVYNGIIFDVTSIGNEAFYYCGYLTSVTIPNSVTTIGRCAFEGCIGLISITIPNSVTSIGDYAFEGCKGITFLSIPNSVTSIGEFAFARCSGLTSLTIPSSVVTIEEYAFMDCMSLNSITVDRENTTYDSRENCNAIIHTASNILILGCANTIIPNNVTHISHYAFRGCKGITFLSIPNSVTSIGEYAFFDCI